MKMLSSLKAATRHPLFQPICAIVAVFVAAYLIAPEIGFALPLALGTTLTEGQHTAEFIVSEAAGTRSRDAVTVTVPANTTLSAGTVLAKLSATGKYVEYDNSGSDGSEAAAAILYAEQVNDTDADVDVTATVLNADAEVRSADLVWKTGLVDADKTAGLADLLALGIKAR